MEKAGQLEELKGNRNPGSEPPPRYKRGYRKKSKKDVRRAAMEKGSSVKIIEERRSEKMTQLNSSSPPGSEKTFETLRGLWK